MGITIATHSRRLNGLEAQAVDLALYDPMATSSDITVTIGQEDSREFVALSRGKHEVVIHFDKEHSLERKPDGDAGSSGSSSSTKKGAGKTKGRR